MTKKEYRQLIAEQLSKARDDILYFTSFIYTVDTHALGENKVCKFPLHKEYLRKLLVLAMSAQRLAIYKSRQLLVTWSMCVIILHELLFNPGAYIGIISKKEEDAGKVLNRVKTLYDYLPLHWRTALPFPQWYKAKKGINVRVVFNHANNKPASICQAYPSGEDQVRMETFSIIYWDEVGFAPDSDARLTYGALKPTIDGGGKLLMSSTPPPNEEHFWHSLCSGTYLQGTQG